MTKIYVFVEKKGEIASNLGIPVTLQDGVTKEEYVNGLFDALHEEFILIGDTIKRCEDISEIYLREPETNVPVSIHLDGRDLVKSLCNCINDKSLYGKGNLVTIGNEYK